MKRFLLFIFILGIFACSGNKQVDIAGIYPSPFIGLWENIVQNDSVQNLSLRIGERNDSLLFAFFWERSEPLYMTGNPQKDSKGEMIPQLCLAVPKRGNRAIGTIVNQYFSVYCNYPKNEYYPIAFELKSLDTLTFKIDGEVNYWPDSAILVRRSNENSVFSTEVVDLYKENYLVPDADVSHENRFDISGFSLSPFIGRWGWEKNSPAQTFYIDIGIQDDSLLFAAGGVFLGGNKIQTAVYDDDGKIIPQARMLAPQKGSRINGTFIDVNSISFYGTITSKVNLSLELFSKNTLLFKTDKSIDYWPDSVVMVRINDELPLFAK